MTALLVTGSRSLARIPGARERCIEHVSGHLVALGDVVLVTGDAPGPDAWAIECAAGIGIRHRRWCLDGWIDGGSETVRWWSGERTAAPSARWPLMRNEAMVRAVAAKHPDAVVLAFVDPHSRTHGTEHTCRLAERAGLRAERKVWGEGSCDGVIRNW
jgi:hypothetical protein